MKEMIEVRERLLKEIEGLSDEDANKKISEERWSIVQIVEHLGLLEKKIIAGIKIVVAQGISEQITKIELERLLDRSVKIQAPKDVMPENRSKSLSEAIRDLEDIRKELTNVITQLTEQQLDTLTMSHRRFGTLNIRSWISLIGFHEQRHIMQIKEVKKALLEN